MATPKLPGGAALGLEKLCSLYSDGHYEAAYTLYRELSVLENVDAEVFLLGGRAALAMGNHYAARAALDLAINAGPEGRTLGMVRFIHGAVLLYLGEIHPAIEQFSAFLQGIIDYPELAPLFRGPALYNRALAYRQARKYNESLNDYWEACEEFRREHMREYLCQALHNRAWVACIFGDTADARAALEESLPLCDTDYLRWHQRIGEAFLAALSYHPSDPSGQAAAQRQALEQCQTIYEHAGADLPADVRSHACWLAGRISQELGELDAAESLALQAVHHGAATRNENRCLHDASELLREIRHARLKRNSAGP